MKLLDVSSNKLKDEEVRHLSSCVAKIEKLRIWFHDITEEKLTMLSSAIKSLRKPVMFVLTLLHAQCSSIIAFLLV